MPSLTVSLATGSLLSPKYCSDMDISKHIEKAEEAVRRKNFDGAISLYEQLLEFQPNDLRARKGLLQAARKRYEYKKPMKALLLAASGPHLAAAKSMQTVKKWKQAADHYQKALLQDPTSAAWCLVLGECLEMSGVADGALAVYEHLAEVDPRNLDALKRAGAILYRKKELAPALEYYERALAINPRDQESLKARKNLAAEGILQQKNFESASSSRDLIKDKAQQQALEHDQRLHKSEEEIAEGLRALEAEAQASPGNPRTFERMGKLQETKGDLDAALASYEKALGLEPQSFDLKVRIDELVLRRYDREIRDLQGKLGVERGVSERLNKLEQDRQAFELETAGKRAAEHPTDLGLRYKYGRLLFRVGRIDESIAELQKAVVDPRWKLECLVTLGQCFFKKDLFDLARKQLEKALEQVPSGSARAKEILYNLGLVAERMGSRGDAAGFYSRIYEIDIGYKDVAKKMEQLRIS